MKGPGIEEVVDEVYWIMETRLIQLKGLTALMLAYDENGGSMEYEAVQGIGEILENIYSDLKDNAFAAIEGARDRLKESSRRAELSVVKK